MIAGVLGLLAVVATPIGHLSGFLSFRQAPADADNVVKSRLLVAFGIVRTFFVPSLLEEVILDYRDLLMLLRLFYDHTWRLQLDIMGDSASGAPFSCPTRWWTRRALAVGQTAGLPT